MLYALGLTTPSRRRPRDNNYHRREKETTRTTRQSANNRDFVLSVSIQTQRAFVNLFVFIAFSRVVSLSRMHLVRCSVFIYFHSFYFPLHRGIRRVDDISRFRVSVLRVYFFPLFFLFFFFLFFHYYIQARTRAFPFKGRSNFFPFLVVEFSFSRKRPHSGTTPRALLPFRSRGQRKSKYKLAHRSASQSSSSSSLARRYYVRVCIVPTIAVAGPTVTTAICNGYLTVCVCVCVCQIWSWRVVRAPE